jgi:hypothetical protein
MSDTGVKVFVGCTLVGLAVAREATATVEVSSTFSSGIYADGSTTPGFFNYYVGYSVPSTPIERRNYFIFDLDGVATPVASATLKLFLPGGPSLPSGFISSEATEDYRISGSAFPWTAFAEAFGGTATSPMLAAMFGTMGADAAYGLTTISGGDSGTDIEIELSAAAILDINASLGSKFLITGRLPDIHPATPGMPPSELVFAYTDIPHPFIPLPRLELTFVPAPGSAAALMAVCGMVSVRRRRGSR